MQTPLPMARLQQIAGVPEHPCEAIVRNGAIICPYEEMDVRYYPEHSGLYLLTLLGEPFEVFASGGARAKVSMLDGHIPVFTYSTRQQGLAIEQTVFACLLDADEVGDGTEDLILMVRMRFHNPADRPVRLPVTVTFANCFREPRESDGEWSLMYWRDFLLRGDMPANLSEETELPPYPYPLAQRGNMLAAEGKGVVFMPGAGCGGAFFPEYGGGSWRDGTSCRNGWRFLVNLEPGGTRDITYRLPYLPLDERKAERLASLDFDEALQRTRAMWGRLLGAGARLDVPGTDLGDLWLAQTAYTFLLIDRQNKGGAGLYGREMMEKWIGDRYPDKLLSYVHLSPTLYEFVWAQEAAYWVMGTLDMQGYHREVERCFELFFALQGVGIPGVHDKSILPDKSVAEPFMGTTPHSWLNGTGGVLSAIARHFRLTGDKGWLLEHKDAVVSACRWIKLLRSSTKDEALPQCRGIMPRGQSTDATFASDHLQWYYTDTGSLMGLRDMLPVMEACGFGELEEFRREVADYERCLLRSIDMSIRDIDDFMEDPRDYDFSPCRYADPLPHSLIREYDEKGMPLVFRDRILTKSEAKRLGLKLLVPMSPQLNIPFKMQYCDTGLAYDLGYLSPIIDFSSDAPLYEGAKHSGKAIWEAIAAHEKLLGLFDLDAGIYSHGLPYNDYILQKLLRADDAVSYERCVDYMLRYGCDSETHVMVETAGISTTENWFQPCPFTLAMASLRKALRNALLYEDAVTGALVVGKAMPKRWAENAMTYEKPVSLERAASWYGPVSLQYRSSLPERRITVDLALHDASRLPGEIEVRMNHPQGLPLASVAVNGAAYARFDAEKGAVHIDPAGFGCSRFIVDMRY